MERELAQVSSTIREAGKRAMDLARKGFEVQIKKDRSPVTTADFEVNRVLLGKHKRQDAGAEDLTRRYKAGTLTFALDANQRKVFTLNIITHFDKGVTYDCVTLFTGSGGEQDAVVAEMTTF